jgi:hypothetical protein
MYQGGIMWQHRFETQTNLPPTAIWPILSDVARWGELDHGIDRIAIDEPPGAGVRFTLKPKGGPSLRFLIGDFAPPSTYSDICRMPLARMTTRHELLGDSSGTTIRVTILIEGPFAPLWGLLVGRKHAAGLPAQTARILDAALARMQVAPG